VLTGFKSFILRGNVIELAVAFVIGAAFVGLVTRVVDGLINPLIAAIVGSPNLDSAMIVTINEAEFLVGSVIGAIINFLLVAAAVYFLIVAPMNALAERRKAGIEPEPEAPAEDILLLQEIRDLLAAKRDI
jgi:large conductance mechanosensitive channel